MKVILMVLLTLTATMAPAGAVEAQIRSRQVVAEGTLAWGADGRCYMVRQGRWVPTAFTRSFPNPANRSLFDVAQDGQFVKRVDLSQPGWIYELDAAFVNGPYTWRRSAIHRPHDTVEYFVPAANRWITPEIVLTNLVAQLNALVAQANNPYGPPARTSVTPDAVQAQIMAINNASHHNMIKIWTAPNCTASYNGC